MLPQIFHSTSFISQKSILEKHCNNYRETRRRSSSPWVGKIYVQYSTFYNFCTVNPEVLVVLVLNLKPHFEDCT